MSAQENHINQTKDTHCGYVSGASHLRIEPLTELKYMEFRYNTSQDTRECRGSRASKQEHTRSSEGYQRAPHKAIEDLIWPEGALTRSGWVILCLRGPPCQKRAKRG